MGSSRCWATLVCGMWLLCRTAGWTAARGTEGAEQPPYDHQTTPYVSSHSPVSVRDGGLQVTPFFSPEHSSATLVAFLESAKRTIDIGTPGFSSWSGCTPFDSSNGTVCMKACTPEEQRAEASAATAPRSLVRRRVVQSHTCDAT